MQLTAFANGKIERFNSYLKGSFLVPLMATLKAGGLKLDADTANREVLRWLAEVAHVRVHATTGERPSERLAADRAKLSALPMLPASNSAGLLSRHHQAIPAESLQHPLSVYDSLLEVA